MTQESVDNYVEIGDFSGLPRVFHRKKEKLSTIPLNNRNKVKKLNWSMRK